MQHPWDGGGVSETAIEFEAEIVAIGTEAHMVEKSAWIHDGMAMWQGAGKQRSI